MRTKQKLSETAQHEVEWNSLFAVGKNVEGKHWTNFITWLRKASIYLILTQVAIISR